MITLGKVLKQNRRALHLDQRGLAKRLGIHSQLVSNWERGMCGVPLKHFRKISKLFKLDLSKMVSIYVGEVEHSLWEKLDRD